jgi:hypothetical protein
MRVVPLDTMEWELAIPPEAAAARLAAHVDRVRNFRSPRFSAVPFEGRVTADGFRLWWIAEGPGFSTVRIRGTFEPTTTGTRVRVRFWPRPPALVAAGIFCSAAAIVFVAISAFRREASAFLFLLPAAFAFAGFFFGSFCFWFRLDEIKDDLRRTLDEKGYVRTAGERAPDVG